jgi:hypothetical protein
MIVPVRSHCKVMIDRAVASADALMLTGIERLPNERLGARNALFEPASKREIGDDRRRQRAARAVRIARFDPRPPQNMMRRAIE